jgi:hypothetical protein
MSASAPAAGAGAPSAAPAPAEPLARPSQPASLPAAAPAIPRCDNCGASVAGRYCGSCGQRLEPPVHSLWHFMALAAEDVTHADSRVWRTLWALLFRPGFLTREFLDGRRARYLPPVRLYLVVSVVFFLVVAWHHQPQVVQLSTSDKGVPKAVHLVPLSAPDAIPSSGAAAGESPAARAQRECQMIDISGTLGTRLTPLLRTECLRIRADNGRSLATAFMHNLPHAMFLFLPLFGALMMLFYWHPRRYYVEHLLFLVHNHAFAFVLLMLAWAVASVLPFAAALVGWATSGYIAWYLYRSLRVVYAQGRGRTTGKLLTLLLLYLMGGSVMLGLVTVYSALTL